MRRCLSNDDLRRYREDALTDEERSDVEAHLSVCSSCAQRSMDMIVDGPQDSNAGASTATADDRSSRTATVTLDNGSDAPRSPSAGALDIEGYELLREIHRGGQGVVYQAIQKSTHRKVAIKVPFDDPSRSREIARRFDREIQTIARLQHPHIVSVFDSGRDRDGRRYVVMDYVRGLPLREYVRRHRLPIDDVLRLFRDVCTAVHHAHMRGIVHRDLKPSNILVTADGVVKVLDFGLAKSLTMLDESAVSVTGQLVGTLAYMSPEQLRGGTEEVDQRSDVYSLGVILYELVTGALPVDVSGDLAAALERIGSAPPPALRVAWTADRGTRLASEKSDDRLSPVTEDLETIVLKALSKERERRYAGADQLIRDIDHYIAGEPIEARRDSIAYVLKTRTRKLGRRHRITACVGCILLALFGAGLAGVPLIYRWTAANAAFESWVIGMVAPVSSADPLENVRIVALTGDTDVETIGRDEGVEEVDINNKRSWRSLHGRAMKRLSESGCRVVAWDIAFRGNTPFDSDFVEGVRALRGRNVTVVVAIPQWWLGHGEAPELSEVIAPEVRWGCAVAGLTDMAAWRLQMVAQRGLRDAQPSLVLASFAAMRHPNARVDYVVDLERDGVHLLYWRPDPSLPELKQRLAESDFVPLAFVQRGDDKSGAFAPGLGLEPDDMLGCAVLHIPSDEDYEKITLDYAELFQLSAEALRARLAGKAVVMADFLPGVDRHNHEDGRTLPGAFAHAAGLNALISDAPVKLGRRSERIFLPMVAATLGLLTALRFAHRPAMRALLYVAIGVISFVVVIGVYGASHYLFNPGVGLIAMVLAGELGVAVYRFLRLVPVQSRKERVS